MMRTVVAILLIIAAAVPASADRLPEEIGYTIYVLGQEAGRSQMKATYQGDSVILKSTTLIDLDGFLLSYESETVADAKTYAVRSFEWSGTKAGTAISGKVTVEGTSVTGTVTTGEYPQDAAREGRRGRIMFLEDYVMAHEVLIARAHALGGEKDVVYDLFQPASFSMASLSVVSASEIAFESNIKETICVKFLLALEGGQGFASYYDEGRGLPVYMAFPGTNTEVFLDEFFGDEPVTRYRK